MQRDALSILIVGGGAVGAFYGSRLAQSSVPSLEQTNHHPRHHIYVVCRSNFNAVQKHGFTLHTHSYGSYTWRPRHIFRSCKDAAIQSYYHVIILTTKALPDIIEMGQELAPLFTSSSVNVDCKRPVPCLLLIQNGVGIERPYVNQFPHIPLLSAITVFSGEQQAPSVIVQNRWTRISIGPFEAEGMPAPIVSQADQMAQQLVSIFKQGGVQDAEYHNALDLQIFRWHKLAINATMSPLSILSGGLSNDKILGDPALWELAAQCMEEVFSTAQAIFKRPFPPQGAASISAILASSARNTGRTSMLLDWQAGREMELTVILRNPIAIAKEHSLNMPRLHTLLCLIEGLKSQKSKL